MNPCWRSSATIERVSCPTLPVERMRMAPVDEYCEVFTS